MSYFLVTNSAWTTRAHPRCSRATPGPARCQTWRVRRHAAPRGAPGLGVLSGMNVIDADPQTVLVAWRCELRHSPHEDADAESLCLKLRRDGSAYRMKTC